ncbi:MAG: UDP-N-acetylmuramoyl-tripeptide--D-alanyl-D-alanine ligase [Alphaproteobacteria bacterium]
MTHLWTLHDIQHALGQSRTGENVPIYNMHMDSRLVVTGDMFVALAGTPPAPFVSEFGSVRDGHAYVPQAVKNGASAVLVSAPNDELNCPQVLVPDTFQALWRLAEEARERSTAKRIAVTGSYGKTTTKDMLGLMLGGHKAESSFNNCWGVPLTLVRLPKDAPFAVLELGMSHMGELAPLARLARPHVAIVTLVGPAHLQGLGTIDNVAQEKLSIQEGLSADGILIARAADVAQWPQLIRRKVLTFSAELHGTDASIEELWEEAGRLHVTANVLNHKVKFTYPASGRHLLGNALAALLAVAALGEDVVTLGQKLSQFELLEGRGATEVVNGVMVIDDSGNGQPLAMQAALRALSQSAAPRKFALIGDMLELGETEFEQHMALKPLCEKLDGVWAVGTRIKPMYDALPVTHQLGWVESAEQLNYPAIAGHLQQGDALLVKASKKILNVYDAVGQVKAALQ